jgi:hypothetical protein
MVVMMSKKINLYIIQKQLNDMTELLLDLRPHKWYEPSIHIKQTDGIERIWKYNHAYYTNQTLLYETVKPNYSIQKFRTILKDPDRSNELFALGIQPEYIKFLKPIGAHICTDGNFLHQNLNAYVCHPFSSGIVIKERKLSRSWIVFKHFISPDISHAPFHIDGNMGNCRVDNLRYHEKEGM